jgi:hypothetical protein
MTVEEAAGVVVGLINSRPHSPTHAEIEAIITSAVARNVVSPTALLTWHPLVLDVIAAVEEYDRACCAASDDDDPDGALVDAASNRLEEVARRVWSIEPTSLADIVARAIIFECWSSCVDDGTGELVYLNPEALADAQRPAYCDWSAEAYLLDAIRKLGGGRRYSQSMAP